MNEASKSILKKAILILIAFAVLVTVICASLSYDEIEEVTTPHQAVDGVSYIQSQETVMKSGETVQLLCSYSFETLSEEDNVYILKFSLYQGDTSGTYSLKNYRANIQLPEGAICRMAYSSDGSKASKSEITYSDGCEVVKCTGSKSLEAEIVITGDIGTCLDVVVSYDIIGTGRRMFMKFHDEIATFELNL